MKKKFVPVTVLLLVLTSFPGVGEEHIDHAIP